MAITDLLFGSNWYRTVTARESSCNRLRLGFSNQHDQSPSSNRNWKSNQDGPTSADILLTLQNCATKRRSDPSTLARKL